MNVLLIDSNFGIAKSGGFRRVKTGVFNTLIDDVEMITSYRLDPIQFLEKIGLEENSNESGNISADSGGID